MYFVLGCLRMLLGYSSKYQFCTSLFNFLDDINYKSSENKSTHNFVVIIVGILLIIF